MKKKVLGGIAVLVIAAVVAINVNLNTNNNDLSDLSLANVEALASSEGGGHLSCYKKVSSEGTDNLTHQTFCADCAATLCRTWSDLNFCGSN